MKIKSLLLVMPVIYCLVANAQVTFTVNCNNVLFPISPYIYGANSTGAISGNNSDIVPLEVAANIASRRFGGDRATPYNWENNISTQGHYGTPTDDENDDYLPSLYGINNCTGTNYNSPCVPNGVNKLFLQNSVAQKNAYSMLTLPMIGYVANNITAPNATLAAPSINFDKTYYQKPGAPASWLLAPSLSNGKVYVDEQLHELLYYCDSVAKINRPNGYSLDNEPTSWSYTHPTIHLAVPKCSEIINQSIALAGLIKNQQPTAETYGAVHVNYAAYLVANDSGNDSTKWSQYNNKAPDFYQNFNQAYLGELKKASDSAGKRLLDALDVHWYPAIDDAKGDYEQSCDAAHPATRDLVMQEPRCLDDSSFQENSWVQQVVGNMGINYLGRLKMDINNRYPGTKVSVSEYQFYGEQDVAGGIAQVDALGRFAKNGVYQADIFDPLNGYMAAAFKLYRNYDGKNSTFGNRLVDASSSEAATPASVNNNGFNNYKYTEIYAASDSTNPNVLHLIVVNKATTDYTANFSINSTVNFTKYNVYGFNGNSDSIAQFEKDVPMAGNKISSFKLPALSALHFVLGNTTNLPVGTIDFTAAPKDGFPLLQWVTSNEANTQQFIIRHGTNGKDFLPIGNVKARGSGANSYSFTDNNPANGINYYRLQSVDKDGASTYSKVVSVNFGDKLSFSIIPNPARDFATIGFGKTVDKATIAVYDITGKAVITQSLSGSTNSYKLNTQTLTNGVYVIKVNTATGSYNEKLLISK